MSLPNDTASTIGVSGVFYDPDDNSRGPLEDFERGGVAVEDTSQGLLAYNWRMWVDGNDVLLQRDGASSAVIFSTGGIQDIAFAFDQNMRPTVAYRNSSETLLLRWYDSLTHTYRTDSFGVGRNPRLSLDDKRLSQSSLADVIFAYIRGSTLYYRQQRDRYQTERVLKAGIPESVVLKTVGMTRGLRLQFELS